MKRVKQPNDVPNGHHYAVIVYNTTSVYVDGDERSRTNPGHGYPAHTDTYDTFEHWVTEDKSVWEAFIAKKVQENNSRGSYRTEPFVCLEVARKATVTSKVVVTTD